MTLVPPAPAGTLETLKPMLAMVEQAMGFVPNSMLTMAHWPELVQAFGGLAGTILGSGEVDPGLKQLVAHVASHSAGCRYCQAHTAHQAEHRGVDPERLRAVFEFETSPLFSDAERAALRVASRGAMQPNAVEPADMAALVHHFGARGAVEIVAVLALFGFLNRWNDSLATTLEEAPRSFAEEQLQGLGWAPGKHD